MNKFSFVQVLIYCYVIPNVNIKLKFWIAVDKDRYYLVEFVL